VLKVRKETTHMR